MTGAAARAVPVMLLGTPVTAWVRPNPEEHSRRATLGLGAVTDPALLDLLLGLPLGIPVDDPVAWIETADQQQGIVGRAPDGRTVTRHLDMPLHIEAVIVSAASGRDLRAVQDASLFASFSRRWVATARRHVPDVTVLEAKLFGVGLMRQSGQILLDAEPPIAPITDCWTWLLREKTYRRMLRPGPGPAA